MSPKASIVIRAFNEERHLPALFDALKKQAFSDFETIVVDSGSFDRTREIAAERATKLVRIAQHDFTFGHSLNVGVKNSSGALIVAVSAHTVPADENWLGNLLEPLAQEKTAMVYGRQLGGTDSKYAERRDFSRTFGTKAKVMAPPDFFANNANSALRRDLWDKHPFDESLPGLEDIEWAKHWMEHGYQVLYEPKAALYHIHDETWAQVRRRYYREGQAAKWIGVKRRKDIPRELWSEARRALSDAAHAAKSLRLGELAGIFRFRFEKTVGTLRGVWDGALLQNPLKRERILFDKTYQAVVIRAPKKAALEELEMPALAPSEVLVRVAYQGVCATDLEIFHGRLGYYASGLASYPIVPGHEFSGVVAAVGARVTSVAEGDRVVVECIQGCGECAECRRGNAIGCAERREVGVIGRNGGYAEYAIVPARFLHTIPSQISLKAAALCEPLAVVLKGFRRLERAWGVTLGPRPCAVVGAGPIGHLAARILESRGHAVTVYDRNPARLKHFADTKAAVKKELDDLSGYDVLVEATGDPDALDAILHRSKAGSTILLLGLPYARREFNFEAIVGYDKVIIGSVGSGPEDFNEALVTLPKIGTAALLEAVLPLARFEEAWELSRGGGKLKVLLEAGAESPPGLA